MGPYGAHPTKPTSLIFAFAQIERGPVFAGPFFTRWGLEVETYLGGQRSRGHVVCTAKCRKEVVQPVFVRDVNGSQLQAHFVLVTPEHIVVPHGKVEKTPGLDALRVVVILFGARRGYLHQAGT